MNRIASAIALSLLLATTPAFADGGNVSKVNGSITAESGKQYGDLSTVNGSIRLQDGSRSTGADTVNGSIRAGDGIESGGLSTVNGSIRVGTQAKVDGNVGTVNGSIFIDRGGIVDGNIETVNGAIGLVATTVEGNVETVAGDVTIGIGSRVTGHIKVIKPTANWLPISVGNKRPPRIVIGPDAVVEGDLVFEREVVLYVHETARTGTVTGATPIPYDTPRAPSQ